MKHRRSFRKLNRKPAHRLSMFRHMATALFRHERVRTTVPKAKEARRFAERLISRARTDTVHNRRILARDVQDKAILAKLFTDIGPRFKDRPGGYTRVLRVGQRAGDATEMAILELVVRKERAKKKPKADAKAKEKDKEKDKEKEEASAAKV